ncbi:hypothetical protein ACKGJO_03605 [Gracilimonas sp. Q87]|uniref:hypothetical protein n=1 Tax=Gracilimonas sp. Q87 TaxID=3384766 RepID=UPI003983FC96
MSEKKLSNLEKKKNELENELANIQSDLDKSIDEVREGVSSNMDPKNIIRRYPLPALGASLVLGFFLGKGRKESSGLSSYTREGSSTSDSGISREIKKVLARKGLSLLLDYLDEKIAEHKHKDTSDRN